MLKSGDAVVAAARRPEQAQGLLKLKQQHGDALQLVKLDVNDRASVKVRRGDLKSRVQSAPERRNPSLSEASMQSLYASCPLGDTSILGEGAVVERKVSRVSQPKGRSSCAIAGGG